MTAHKIRVQAGRRRSARTAPDRPPAVPPPRRLPLLLRHAWFSLNQAFRRRVGSLGLTPDQYTVLRTLAERDGEGLTQRELSELMCSDPNTVVSLLDRMEAAGLLERQPHPEDRRAHRLHLVPLGRRRLETAREVAQRLQAEVVAALTEEEEARFLEYLERIAQACHEALGRSPRHGG